MGSKQQAESSRKMAAYMKEKKITRKQGRCGICHRMAPIPMDNHIMSCRGPRR